MEGTLKNYIFKIDTQFPKELTVNNRAHFYVQIKRGGVYVCVCNLAQQTLHLL